jgi:hypothetical protein
MAAYLPPTEAITSFNTSLFTHDSGTGLSQGLADTLYVKKTNSVTENINGLKTFTNNVEIFNASLPSLILTATASTQYSRIRQNASTLQIQSLSSSGASTDFLFSGVSQLSVSQGFILTQKDVQFQTKLIKALATETATAHTIFDNMIAGATITMGGTASTNSIRGDTTFPQNVIISGTASIGGRITLNSASYTFPFSSSLIQGYYAKDTGSATNVTSSTPKTIHTSPTLAVGVWRIDFSVETLCNVAGGAGQTITTSQSYVSTTANSAMTAVVPHTGAKVYSVVSKTYQPNEYDLITSSFTYNQTTAGVLYLNLVRIYTGDFTFTGEMSYTRIA